MHEKLLLEPVVSRHIGSMPLLRRSGSAHRVRVATKLLRGPPNLKVTIPRVEVREWRGLVTASAWRLPLPPMFTEGERAPCLS